MSVELSLPRGEILVNGRGHLESFGDLLNRHLVLRVLLEALALQVELL